MAADMLASDSRWWHSPEQLTNSKTDVHCSMSRRLTAFPLNHIGISDV